MQFRTKLFALRSMRLCRELSDVPGEGWAIRDQLVRSGTAVAANYRAACRSRSRQEFAARMGVVVEETDESLFWMELITDAGLFTTERLEPLMREADELWKIFASARQTTLRKLKTQKSKLKTTACEEA